MPREDNQRARRLVDKYADMILRLGVSYLGNRADAEDITQETLLALLHTSTVFRSPEHEKAWVLRTAINRCKDQLKSAAHRLHADSDPHEHPSTHTHPESAPVTEAVQQLPEDQRIAIHLFYYEGYSATEIAELTDSTPDAIYQRLRHARRALAATLQGVHHA